MLYSKLSNLDYDLVSTMSGLADTPDKIDLAGNFSFDLIPEIVLEQFNNVAESDRHLPAPPNGLPFLRSRISERIANIYGHVYEPIQEMTITNGVPQTIYAALSAFLDEGDEVILFEPADEHYLPNILYAGARPVYIPLKEPDFHIDWEEVTRMITSNTRIIIINTPHNPSGMVLSELDMLRLQKVINGTRIIVISDESFENLVFEGAGHQSVALYPKLAEKSILINSLSVSCRVPWPVSFCAAPRELMVQIRKVLHVINGNLYLPFQIALANSLPHKELFSSLNKYYLAKRDFFESLMRENTRFTPIKTSGSWYQLYSYSAISDEKDKAFAMQLFNETGITTAPYSAFFHEKNKLQALRFNFARTDEVLENAVEKLSRL